MIRRKEKSLLRTKWRFFSGRKTGLGLLLVIVVLMTLGGGLQNFSSADTENNKPTEKRTDDKAPRKKDVRETPGASDFTIDRQGTIVNVIPDIRSLVDAPNTIIDLSDKFSDQDVVWDEQSLEIIEEEKHKQKQDKDKIVLARIEKKQLILDYQKIGKTYLTIRAKDKVTGQYIYSKFIVEVWKPDYFRLVQIVVGGLAIFLLGMKNMSEGLQAVAGGGLRRMISAVTNNRMMATGVGVLVTTMIQSSSITTVMVVGFVNSGFMTLGQGIGVIMGANIGTTITGWILVLNIGKYGLPILGIAAFIYLFSKYEKPRYFAMAVMGLGMIFFGLELMKNGFSTIKELPAFEDWFQHFRAENYFGVLKCAMVGCVLTMVVQSSSATLGITIGLAATKVIPFETAAALVLGENIGTTITALLASIGATTNAKRAAYFHVIFNLIGVMWITALFFPYIDIIKLFFEQDALGNVYNTTAAIALTHTGFNLANTLLFLPFSTVFANLLLRFVPDKHAKEKPHLTSLDIRILETPVISIEQSRIEILRMGEGCKKMMVWLNTLTQQDVPDEKMVEKTFHREEVLDTIQDEIVAFMTHLLSGDVPHTLVDEARRQLRMADEFESVSDYLVAILRSHLKLVQAGLRFSEKEKNELAELHGMVADYLELVDTGYAERQPEIITKAHSQGSAISHRVKELRNEHLVRLSDQKVVPQLSVAYNAQLNAYRRVRDHVLNIAEALAGEK